MTSPPLFTRPFLAAGLAVLALSLSLFVPSTAVAVTGSAVATPAVPESLPAGSERLAGYVPQIACDPTAKPGAVKLAKLLTATYPNTSYGIARACGASPDSEHYDGRAIDWMNSYRNATQAAQAKAVLAWLFAADAAGHPYANARRLGVMYIIWDNKMWGAYSADRGWRAYSSCASHPELSWDTTCHRNHMHLSLSWEGAMGQTSFWTGAVASPDYGPCRPKDLNWAAPYKRANPIPCVRYAVVQPPLGASANLRTLTTYSGIVLRTHATGTAVRAVQKAVGTTVDGTYGAATVAAVKSWQTAHHLDPSGGVYAGTWRSLLKAGAPSAS
jgi:hypothetical protein